MNLPPQAFPLLAALAPAFTRPTYRRFATLLIAATLTTGRRTVANLLRTLGGLAEGHRTDYQRVLSRAPWSALDLASALAGFILLHLVPDGTVVLVGDDTVDGHPGKKVYGKARHRDPVRPTHSHTAWRYGHKWVVLAVLVRLPFATRPWALPILVDLDRSAEDDRRRKRPHRTPGQLMCRLLRLVLIRFPGRRFLFIGDAGDGTHELARFSFPAFHAALSRPTGTSGNPCSVRPQQHPWQRMSCPCARRLLETGGVPSRDLLKATPPPGRPVGVRAVGRAEILPRGRGGHGSPSKRRA